MKAFFYVFLCLAATVDLSHGDLVIGSCTNSWFLIEKAYCDIKFVKLMNASSNAKEECPDLYQQAHECFEKKVYDECFEDDDHSEKHNKTIAFLEAEFGDEDFFCMYGFLPTMKGVMSEINTTSCIDQKFVDYKKCEDPFRDAFESEFADTPVNLTRLAWLFAEAQICQSEITSSCPIPNNETTYHFFDSNEFNPYDPVTMKEIEDAANKIEHGEDVGSDSATVITVVIVVLVLLAILGGVFYYLRRRDKARAEIRRQKKEGGGDGQPKNGDAEMQPLSSAAVMHASDEVSSA